MSNPDCSSDLCTSVPFSPDSTRLASASWDRTVKVWDARSGECLSTLEGHSAYVNRSVVRREGNGLGSGYRARAVNGWAAGSGECLSALVRHCVYVCSE